MTFTVYLKKRGLDSAELGYVGFEFRVVADCLEKEQNEAEVKKW